MIVVSFGVFAFFACPLLVLHIHIIDKLIANHSTNLLVVLGILHQFNKSCDLICLCYTENCGLHRSYHHHDLVIVVCGMQHHLRILALNKPLLGPKWCCKQYEMQSL